MRVMTIEMLMEEATALASVHDVAMYRKTFKLMNGDKIRASVHISRPHEAMLTRNGRATGPRAIKNIYGEWLCVEGDS